MTAYTYFRLYITQDGWLNSSGNWYCNVAELNLLDASDVEYSYAGATFTSSGNHGGASFDASKAFDNNDTTTWSGNMNSLHTEPRTPTWLKVQMSSPVTVASFSIKAYSDSTPPPRDFELQGSNDDVNWDTLFAIEGETWAISELKTYILDGTPAFYAGQLSRETLYSDPGGILIDQFFREVLRSGTDSSTKLQTRFLFREVLMSPVNLPPSSGRRRMSFM